ncbi:MAG: S8 family serine peptidase [Candidatus Calescibacterium sp.]|nr:S8 family serine peptidase [Candidatus Calescibacterium sp.]MDW8132353.1 S8 family serine peptidase [Candidatus Calescibacterium sp.]
MMVKEVYQNVIKAINKIVDKAKGMDKKVVVNMSLGGPATKPWDQDPLCIAIHNAIKEGIYFVVAAGNSGPKEGTVATPGITPDVITVASYDDKKTEDLKDDDIAISSSRGPVLNAPDDNSKIKPDIAISGVRIWAANSPGSRIDKQADLGLVPRTADKKYVALSGTSMAAPAISGIVALILQVNPSLKPHEVKKIIIENGIPLNKKDPTDGKPYDKYDQGSGLINAYQAVKKASKIMNTKKY